MTANQLHSLKLLLTSFGAITGALTDNMKTPGSFTYEDIVELQNTAIKDFNMFCEATRN